MFRRLPDSLPSDPVAGAHLAQLGYFINEDDQIRMVQNPDNKFLYKINRSDRVNEVNKEAMNACIREIVTSRLCEIGLESIRLPLGAEQADPHVPIYVSKNIESKTRVIVVFGQRNHESGIFSYRTIGDEGIRAGSAIDMVNAVLNERTVKSEQDSPGIILANPGQLLWYRGGGRAVSDAEWSALPRASAVHEQLRIDPVKNRAPGHATYTEHVQYVFEHVMASQINPAATFDIIGLEYTGRAVMHYLADHWHTWSRRISGICLGNPQHTVDELEATQGSSGGFIDFVRYRVRAYMVSDQVIESIVPGLETFGCNCYSGGEEFYEEAIIVKAWRSMLEWFNIINTIKDYQEPVFTVIEATDGEHRGTW